MIIKASAEEFNSQQLSVKSRQPHLFVMGRWRQLTTASILRSLIQWPERAHAYVQSCVHTQIYVIKKNLKDVISVFGVIYTSNLTQTWDWVRKIVMSWRLVWIELQNSQVRECVSIHACIANGQSKCPFGIITKRMVKSRGCSCVLQAKSDLLIFILPVSKESSLNS